MKTQPHACLSALVLTLLAACSGSDDPAGQEPGSSSEGDARAPCELISAAEIEAVVDSEIADADGSRTAGNRLCVWYDAQGSTVMTLRLDGELALYRAAAESETSVPVGGVGDEAYLAAAEMVHVKAGAVTFFTQSRRAVADGTIGKEVLAAVGSASASAQAKYEAGYRMAKLVANRL